MYRLQELTTSSERRSYPYKLDHSTARLSVCVCVCVCAVDDVLSVMRQGLITRRVGETQKNRASSRSHAVFTCTVNKIIGSGADGVTHVVRSKLTIVDLAGASDIVLAASHNIRTSPRVRV